MDARPWANLSMVVSNILFPSKLFVIFCLWDFNFFIRKFIGTSLCVHLFAQVTIGVPFQVKLSFIEPSFTFIQAGAIPLFVATGRPNG
jgi:hypothetical protein